MRKEKWKKVERLFHQLTESDSEQKSEILDILSKEDPEVYEVLLELLESDAQGHPIFAETPQHIFEKLENESSLIGENIGAFRLKSIIGNGAMGSVFLAERNDGQFEQTVAIKLLKPMVMDPRLREFFQRERQILAKLNHPNIARLYDGGFTAAERPFFTMEYVSGKTILDYIKTRNLDLKQRLSLFLQVCQAVQYAHQSLVVHLDLKPQNILVNTDAQVKLLDFGVAKILEDSDDSKSSFTLAYASPEQILARDAGTSSDIYSLGIIFFELICGAHPFGPFFNDPIALKAKKLAGKDKDFSPEISKNFPFQSDLKLIYQKATKLNPLERYQAVQEMMRDIKSFLRDYPVSVHPKSWNYLSRKYFKRNVNTVLAVGIAGFLLLGSGIYHTIRLGQERDLARIEAKKAQQITDLLTDVFMAADPNVGGADTITAVQLLNQGYENLEKNLGDEPEMLASMMVQLSPIYLNLGQYEKGRELAEKALEINLALESVSAETIAENEIQLASYFYFLGKLDSSLLYSEKALTRLKDAGIEHGLILASSLIQLGNVLYDFSDYDQADSIFNLALKIHSEELKAPDIDIAFDLHMIGANAREKGDFEKAEKYLLEALEMKKELFEEPHLEIAYTFNHLGSLYQSMGKDSIALGYIKQSLDQRKAILGEYHVETMASMANYARTMVRIHRSEIAVPIYEQALVITDSIVGKEHIYFSALMGSLGAAYFDMEEYKMAKEKFLWTASKYREILSEKDPRISSAYMNLGKTYMKENNLDSALFYFKKTLDIRLEIIPDNHLQIAQSQQALGECLLAIGDYSTAIEYLESAKQGYQSLTDPPMDALSTINASLLAAREAK
ncbi:serine/threonine-protein kinase [Algoriphagus pacificus]|uniref:Serine/threonine protein kinase n=1 Tax=Algoriphagus pacificus TaxID=2811234 RepID=A0ABS3CHM5_9BACT|nr:serine/threonine-protein kinase [Algoriphagus pacificus]MBN7815656.1 serine/threonine protein kinase [Algoriphagus pacificus]